MGAQKNKLKGYKFIAQHGKFVKDEISTIKKNVFAGILLIDKGEQQGLFYCLKQPYSNKPMPFKTLDNRL